ncbi:MAG: uncharacterized protein A8A55_2826 [Amphiamblys sp. WSBS2006]|nr:MAG: uncharacterized protein A8A55_2826 [Amphiamblys sp. WSBS2006]
MGIEVRFKSTLEGLGNEKQPERENHTREKETQPTGDTPVAALENTVLPESTKATRDLLDTEMADGTLDGEKGVLRALLEVIKGLQEEMKSLRKEVAELKGGSPREVPRLHLNQTREETLPTATPAGTPVAAPVRERRAVRKVSQTRGEGAKRRAVEVTEEDSLNFLTKVAQPIAIVGYQVTKGPLGSTRKMLDTLSGGKGKIISAEYSKEGLWILGEKDGVAEVARKLDARGATKVSASAIGSLRPVLEKSLTDKAIPQRKKELFTTLVAEGGLENAVLEGWGSGIEAQSWAEMS